MIKKCPLCNEDVSEEVIIYDKTGEKEHCPGCGFVVPHWTNRFVLIGGPRSWGKLTIRLTKQHLEEVLPFENFWHRIEISSQLAFCMGQFESYLASTNQDFVAFVPEAIVVDFERFFQKHPDIGQIKSFERLSDSERKDVFNSFKLRPRPDTLPFDPEYDE